jgi:hypothetical protein
LPVRRTAPALALRPSDRTLMVPRISARHQKRFGVTVAIERMRGIQYRCLRCNQVFYELDELDAHVREETPGPPSPQVPRSEQAIQLRMFYLDDIREGCEPPLKERK